MTDLGFAASLLVAPVTCALAKGGAYETSTQRGVAPLMQWLDEGRTFTGYAAADRVVGKAAAFLYVLLGVKAVYAEVISEPALGVLRGHGIPVEAQTVVERIVNRKGDGLCPMESAVMEIEDAERAYEAIGARIRAMKGKDGR